MKGSTALLLLAAALCVASAAAQDKQTDARTTLENNGYKLAAAVADIAGVNKAISDPKARYTFLVPTDAAIQAFLKDMGLTVDDLKKRPLLAKHLVGQHTLLGSNVREQEVFANGNTRKAATLAAPKGTQDIEFKRTAPGKFTVTDPQGNAANVVGKPVSPDEEKTFIPIDRVLMGPNYYTNFASVCKNRQATVSAFCDAVKTAGLGDALAGKDLTVFVPNNEAFKAATAGGAPSKDALANILKYHVVSGLRTLPADWKDGEAVKSLEGKDLTVTYKRVSGAANEPDYAEASVNGAQVLKPNVFVGKVVAHGIDKVLVPGAADKVSTEKGATATPAATAPKTNEKAAATTTPAATTTTTTPAAGAAAPKTTEKAAATTTPTAAAAAGAPKTNEKAAATATPVADASKAATTPATKSGSRKLLGWGWAEEAGSVALQDATSKQIEAAVSGNQSAADAANKATTATNLLSVRGGAGW